MYVFCPVAHVAALPPTSAAYMYICLEYSIYYHGNNAVHINLYCGIHKNVDNIQVTMTLNKYL